MNRTVIGPNVLMAVALCTSSAAGEPRTPLMRSDRCTVALAYIDALLAQPSKLPRVFSTQQEPIPDLPKSSSWMSARYDRHGASPSQALLRQLSNDAVQNAITGCASVRAALNRRGIRYGDKAAGEVAQSSAASSYKAELSSVSLPVVSQDGKEALLISSRASGPLEAVGFLKYLRRLPSGAWVVVSSATLWVS